MSTPTLPRQGRPDAPVTPTRQQLDELDALLQRMLALPVNHLDENGDAIPPPDEAATATETLPPPAEPEPEPWRDETPTPADSEVASPVMEVRWLPIEPELPIGEEVAGLTAAPGVDTPGSLVDTPGSLTETPAEWIAPPPPAPVEREAVAPPPPEPRSPARRPRFPGRPAGSWLRPLVWGNRAFDRATRHLGAPGAWLRRPRGRAILGWVGMAFLAAAAVLVLLGRIGWTW